MQVIDEKVGLHAGVDKNFVPVGFQWEVRRTIRDDNGKVVADNLREMVPVSPEELQAHIAQGLTARDADIKADREEGDALKAERDEALNALAVSQRDAGALAEEHGKALASIEKANADIERLTGEVSELRAKLQASQQSDAAARDVLNKMREAANGVLGA